MIKTGLEVLISWSAERGAEKNGPAQGREGPEVFMHMPAQELAHIQTMVIAVRCHGVGERGEAESRSPNATKKSATSWARKFSLGQQSRDRIGTNTAEPCADAFRCHRLLQA